jgi:hypothetical protein
MNKTKLQEYLVKRIHSSNHCEQYSSINRDYKRAIIHKVRGEVFRDLLQLVNSGEFNLVTHDE